MKIAVIGLGSMGKRRIRLIKKINQDAHIIGIDDNKERCIETSNLYGIECVDTIDDLSKHECSCACICTSPLSHAKIINKCLKMGMHVFSEINLVEDLYDENISIAQEKNLVLFLSSTRLYRKEIKFIEKEVEKSQCKINYIYHIGQYLPDWHPWESYKNFFVGNKRTNGCREIMAIELPWLWKIFGKIKETKTISEKITKLDIDYPDSFLIQITHESGTKGLLAVDVVCRKAVRNLEIFGENIYITWNGSPSGLYKLDLETKEFNNVKLYNDVENAQGYSPIIIENAYQDELINFFDCVSNKAKPVYDFELDKEILQLINIIESTTN